MKIFQNYDISYKNSMGAKPIAYLVQKIDSFIKIYDGIRYLMLFASERCNAIYNRISYLISEKSGITYSINHSFAEADLGLLQHPRWSSL